MEALAFEVKKALRLVGYLYFLESKLKVLVLNYTGYRSNWGSQATSRGLLQWLSCLFSDMGGSIDILPYPPTHWLDHWQAWRYGEFLENLYLGKSVSLYELKRLESLCHARFGGLLDRVRSADLIVFQGEGAVGGSRAYRRTQLFGLPLLAKQLYGKKVVSINQTLSFSTEHQARMLRAIYGAFDLNYVRELETLTTCAGVGWPKFRFMPDAAFFYRSEALYQQDAEFDQPYFCVSGSADLNSYDLNSYALNILDIAKRWRLLPVFVYSRSSDSKLVDVYRKIGGINCKIISAKTHPDVDQLLGILARAVVVIGGRYHTSVSALSLNVPVILTRSNSHKSVGLAKMFKGDVALVDHADAGAMMSAMEHIMLHLDEVKARIQIAMKELEGVAADTAADFRRYLIEADVFKRNEGDSMRPAFGLGGVWRSFSPFKSLFRSVNLGVYDRVEFVSLDHHC